jgi:hypothetical protein
MADGVVAICCIDGQRAAQQRGFAQLHLCVGIIIPTGTDASRPRIGASGRASAGETRARAEAALIRHIVFFTAKRHQDIDAIESGLRRLGEIPHSTVFEVSRNTKVDPLCDQIDVVVYAEFEDEAALAAYKAHPIYADTTAKVRPLREMRFSADIAVPVSVANAA